jgi:hypothetical protein
MRFHLHPCTSISNAHQFQGELTSVTLFRRHLDGNIYSSLSRQKTKATLTRESQINVVSLRLVLLSFVVVVFLLLASVKPRDLAANAQSTGKRCGAAGARPEMVSPSEG